MLLVYTLLCWIVVTAAEDTTCGGFNKMFTHLLKSEREIVKLTSRLELVESQLQKNTAAITANADHSTTQMDAIRNDLQNVTQTLARMNTDVAFEVGLPHDISVPDHSPIKFAGIMYNKGDGYRSSSGIFTAPVTGTYIFWAHILPHIKLRLHVYIKHNGKAIGKSHNLGDRVYDAPSITTVAFINKGDQVWFDKFGASQLRGNYWSSFGGALLRSN